MLKFRVYYLFITVYALVCSSDRLSIGILVRKKKHLGENYFHLHNSDTELPVNLNESRFNGFVFKNYLRCIYTTMMTSSNFFWYGVYFSAGVYVFHTFIILSHSLIFELPNGCVPT